MKIIIVGPAHPFRGGIADTNESWCRALNKLDHDCSIVTFTLQYPSFLFPGKTQLSKDPKPKDLEIHQYINSINPISWRTTAKLINQANPDLVIFRYWLPFMGMCFTSIARRLDSKIKKISLCDNVLPHEPRVGDKYLTQNFLNQMDGFITMSSKVARELKDFSKKKQLTIPHPINDGLGALVEKAQAKKQLDLDPEFDYILFFGLVRKYKGLDLLLKAMATPSLKTSKVKLLIAGEFYDKKESYLDLIDSLDLRDRVIINDQFIPSDEIKYYFGACDLVAQTYHSASQSGITPMAIHFEKPMLVTDVGGLTEGILHRQNGLIADKDPIQIAAHIYEFFQENQAAKYEAEMRKMKADMTWENFSDKVIKFVTDL